VLAQAPGSYSADKAKPLLEALTAVPPSSPAPAR
jgi:hypothetical protein